MSAEVLAAKEQGNTAFRNNNLDEAIQWFTTAINLDKQNASKQLHTFYSNRSATYMKLDKYEEAYQDGLKCIEVKPDWGKGYSRAGCALFSMGRYQEAQKIYQEGLKRDPLNSELKSGLTQSQTHCSPRVNLSTLLHFCFRLFILLNGLMYFNPVSRGFAAQCYRRFFFLSIVNYVYCVYLAHGLPKFNMEYLTQVMRNGSTQYIFLSFLFLSQRPNMLAVIPILLGELLHIVTFLSTWLPSKNKSLAKKAEELGNSLMSKFFFDWNSYNTKHKWNVLNNQIPALQARTEVIIGIMLILEMMTPARNFFNLFLYWQFLQMRYTLDSPSGHVRNAFKSIDAKILTWLSHRYCPRLLATLYHKIRSVLANAVQPPEPGQAARPRCTIM